MAPITGFEITSKGEINAHVKDSKVYTIFPSQLSLSTFTISKDHLKGCKNGKNEASLVVFS